MDLKEIFTESETVINKNRFSGFLEHKHSYRPVVTEHDEGSQRRVSPFKLVSASLRVLYAVST